MAPRKKQVKEIIQNASSQSIETPVNPLEDTLPQPVPPKSEPPVKQKRERKSKKYDVVAIITPDGIQGNLQTEQRSKPLIACLPVHSSEIKFHDQPLAYDPSIPPVPVAFDKGEMNPFAAEANYEIQPGADTLPVPTLEQVLQKKNVGEDFSSKQKDEKKGPTTSTNPVVQTSGAVTSESVVTATTAAPRKIYGPAQLLVQFANSKQTHELPENHNVACFWCCESFEGRACVIPQAIQDTVWNVYGCFCTPQCACAYLLSEILDTHVRWERIALLNRLYGKQCNGRVYPAPNRECLERFGGPITTAEFRGICENQRLRLDMHMPPMVSILATMDTKPIDFYETNVQTKLTNTMPNITSLLKTDDSPAGGLKLKRSKPLKDRESTLDSCLNIQVKVK